MGVSPALRIQLLGGFGLGPDRRDRSRLPTARQQQLLAFLVLHAGHGAIPRQRVSGSLWPDSSDDQALTNLRRELHHFRETFPELSALIDAGSRTLAWRGDQRVTVDVLAFEDASARGLDGDAAALRQAATLYHGDLLPDCGGEWIEGDRERLRQRAKQVLSRLVQILEQERAFAEAIERAEQLLRLDQLDEQAWCALMRCHAQRGERAAALHHYQRCAAVLKKELGIQPGAATRLTYREVLELDAAAPATPEPPRTALYPLVGRQAEWSALLNAWRAAAAGQTRLAVVRGEAGIGKTRLAEELLDWCGVNGIATASARCYAFEGRLAYAPIADWVKSDTLKPALLALDPASATDVARLCPELLAVRHEVPPPERQLESWQRRRFFDALAQAFRATAPLVLVLDDLQWADGDTLEWLQYFARAGAGTRCLVVATLRAEEEQDNPPLGRLLAHLERDHLLTTIALGPLDRTATALLAGEVTGQPLDEPALARTFRETEGHPLFIVERGRMELAGETAGGGVLPHVQSVVAARLTLLSSEARATAEVAAAIGRDFRFDLLAQASDLEEPALVRALDELWRRHIVRVQSDERWDFSHDRIREVAYSEIGPARRRLIHRRVAQGMELLFADRLDEASASIAEHLADGGQPARAVSFLERAAAAAMRLSAAEEAIRCLMQALSLVGAQPAGPERDSRELALRSSLSVALNATHGYASPEVERNLERVFALLVPNGRGQVPVRWLWVAFTLRFMLGDLKGTRQVSEQALALSAGDPSCRCEAHHAMGGTLLHVGELDASRQHFDAAIAAYDEALTPRSALGSDLGVFAHAWSAHTVFLLGDEAAAVERAEQAVSLARRQDHAYSEALALAYAALLHQMRRDCARLVLCAEAAIALCDRYGIGYYGDWALALLGWAKGHSQPAAGIAAIESAIEKLDRHRARARRPYYLSLLADTHRRLGHTEQAEAIVDRAIDMAIDRSDVWWLPALLLQKSEMAPAAARDALLQRALALARAQNSRALEHRILGSDPSGMVLADGV